MRCSVLTPSSLELSSLFYGFFPMVHTLRPCFTLLSLSTACPRQAGMGIAWTAALQPQNKQKMQLHTSSTSAAPKAKVTPTKLLMLHLGMDFATVFETMCKLGILKTSNKIKKWCYCLPHLTCVICLQNV